jgi:predicted kinase
MNSHLATAHLICGSTGAGKTTYSRELGKKKSSFLFSIDQWMKSLFWMDSSSRPDLDWALERVGRCEDQIWLIAEQLLKSGIDVILDLGFSRKIQREKFYHLSSAVGVRSQLHFLNIPVEVRKRRVIERNKRKSETFEFEVNEETFLWMETYFETPKGEELERAIVISE